MFRGAKVVWRSSEGIRELVIRYYTERKSIPGDGGELEDCEVNGGTAEPGERFAHDCLGNRLRLGVVRSKQTRGDDRVIGPLADAELLHPIIGA